LAAPISSGVAHVVRGIAEEREGDLLDGLLECSRIVSMSGQDLGRVELVCQAVPHWEHRHSPPGPRRCPGRTRGIRCRLEAAQYPRGVLDRLLVAHLRRDRSRYVTCAPWSYAATSNEQRVRVEVFSKIRQISFWRRCSVSVPPSWRP
jgi:hypothetical protein